MTDFKERYGPVALVTGASSGIGRAFAELLAERGFDLVLTARRLDRLEDLAGRLSREHGIKAQALQLDLAQPGAPRRLLDATGDLDVGLVVSNAGYGQRGEHSDTDADVMAEMLLVNCHAPMQLAHGFLPRLKARGRGGFLMTGSVEGLIGCPYSTAYSASKALVKSLGEGLWAEMQPYGIDVLVLAPGATDTEAITRSGMDAAKMPNVMPPRDVALCGLDNLRNGPMVISSDHYRASFDQLLSMPRPDALRAMAEGMRQAGGLGPKA